MFKKDEKFLFEDAHIRAFEQLKRSLTENPVLKIYCPEDDTEVHADASQDGLSAVLLQYFDENERIHPVYYTSRKTIPAERKYTSYELEVLVAIEALRNSGHTY